MHCVSGRCDLCAKELADDLDVANAALDLTVPKRGDWYGRRNIAVDVMALVAEIRRPFVRRRVERAFARRTAEQIRAGRKPST